MAALIARLLATAAAATLLTGASGTIAVGPGKPPVLWVARSAGMDYEAHVMHLRGDVKISQGEISIAADQADATATTAEMKTSHWVFTGKVHVRSESRGDLYSDRATVEIRNGELASALMTGAPAQFEQTRSSNGRLVKGHANSINYDVASAVVTLTDDAWLTDDHDENDMKACEITYNVRDRQIQGQSERCPGGRVHMTILPRNAPVSSSAPAADPGQPKP